MARRISASHYDTTMAYTPFPIAFLDGDTKYGQMSCEARVLYTYCLSLLKASRENGKIDEFGDIYIHPSMAAIQKVLGCSKNKALKIKSELKENGLIEEEKNIFDSNGGQWANHIYIMELDLELSNKEMLKKTTGKEQVETENRGGSKNELPPFKNCTPSVQKMNPNKNNIINNILDNSSREAGENLPLQKQEDKYIRPKYYSLLQVIVDKYNDRYCYPQGYRLTHEQKMKIGQYLESGYVKSDEILNMIDRIPHDCESPLAYLLKMLQNLKLERQVENS